MGNNGHLCAKLLQPVRMFKNNFDAARNADMGHDINNMKLFFFFMLFYDILLKCLRNPRQPLLKLHSSKRLNQRFSPSYNSFHSSLCRFSILVILGPMKKAIPSQQGMAFL